jgi:hypothetical protein
MSTVKQLYGHAVNLHTLEPYYSRHVSAMTTEGLHGKGDIAAELAWRDKALADAVALLTRCKTCGKPATRGYPTAEIGYYIFGCDEHRQGPEHDEDSDGHAFDMKQATLVRSLREVVR